MCGLTLVAWAIRLAIVAAMKLFPLFLCSLALSLGLVGCKSESAAPAEPEAVAEPALAADTAEPAAAGEAAPAEPSPATDVDPPPPAPVVKVDPNAPADVAAPPKDAKGSASGLMWMRLKKGEGKSRPGKFDTVTLSYVGWTPDGRRFDSSDNYGGSLSVPANHLIQGFSEGVRMMVAGEKRRLWIPASLGYGEVGQAEQASPRQPLGPLVFDVELIDFKTAPTPPAAPKDVGRVPEDATKLDSGLAWRVIEEGVGTEHPKRTSVVELVFTVWTADGEVVDSSTLRGGVDTVGISRLVPGWSAVMALMVEGERRMIWIPEDLGYQGAPHRPPGMLTVDAKLISIRRDLHQIQ